MSKAFLTVSVGDCHVGCRRGLCPPSVILDGGDEYRPSTAQAASWASWLDFWTEMAQLAKARRVQAVNVVFGGDMTDKNHHKPGATWSRNPKDIKAAAAEVADVPFVKFKKIVPKIKIFAFVLRGTEAHVGRDAYIEEWLAEDISAEKSPCGAASWWTLDIVSGGVNLNFQHHPEAASYREHTDGNAARTCAAEIFLSYTRRELKPPKLAVRHHTHRFQDSGRNLPIHCLFNWGWQLTTSYGHRLGAGTKILPIGGLWILCEEGQYQYDELHYIPKRSGPWQQKQ
uniref:Calcineurin-like phosphoesterase n=1 Tax=viral metagenome TaxID=1070528 RepID=A0A6H1ZWZ4_9ZZZZ